MPERPLLILPTPTEPAKRIKKNGRGGHPHLPSRDRQVERLTPRFSILQETLETKRAHLRTESSGVIPEEVIVPEFSLALFKEARAFLPARKPDPESLPNERHRNPE